MSSGLHLLCSREKNVSLKLCHLTVRTQQGSENILISLIFNGDFLMMHYASPSPVPHSFSGHSDAGGLFHDSVIEFIILLAVRSLAS